MRATLVLWLKSREEPEPRLKQVRGRFSKNGRLHGRSSSTASFTLICVAFLLFTFKSNTLSCSTGGTPSSCSTPSPLWRRWGARGREQRFLRILFAKFWTSFIVQVVRFKQPIEEEVKRPRKRKFCAGLVERVHKFRRLMPTLPYTRQRFSYEQMSVQLKS